MKKKHRELRARIFAQREQLLAQIAAEKARENLSEIDRKILETDEAALNYFIQYEINRFQRRVKTLKKC